MFTGANPAATNRGLILDDGILCIGCLRVLLLEKKVTDDGYRVCHHCLGSLAAFGFVAGLRYHSLLAEDVMLERAGLDFC